VLQILYARTAPDLHQVRAQFSHRGFTARRLLLDKGKPTARWGRKATDQAMA